MEFETKRKLVDIAPLLERLDRGETLSEEEQAELAAIRSLNGSGWEGELPHSICTLTALESLDLPDSQVRDLTPLRDLTALKFLNLRYTQVSDLTPLSGLTNLRYLEMMVTEVSDLNPLRDLTALESLNLVGTPVSDLTPLSGLKFLQSLGLSFTYVRDLSPLSSLAALESLDLLAAPMSDLTPLSGLTALKSLSLSGTQVNDLTPLCGLTALKSLSLFSTQVSDLEPLRGLVRLEHLNLRDCDLRAIPRELYERLQVMHMDTEYHKEGLCLHGATLSTQPISIFGESDEAIRAYYDAPKVPVRESKVIFLGDGGAGKTHTIKRILNKGKDDNIGTDVTLGISIQPYTAHEDGADEFKINFWDFGGQENMHAMHRCFLTERTLYVVVINNRWDLDQQARYWLDNIHSFAPDSPVILAVNLWEGIHKYGLDTNRLHRDYPNLVEVQRYSAKGEDNGNFAALINLIVEQAEKLDSCAMELPVKWAAIRQELIDKASSDEWYMDRESFHEICEKHGLGEEQSGIRSWLLEWFNDLGICFSYHRDKQTREELGTYKVLNPKWLTSAIYILLNTAKKNYHNGVMTLGMIENLLESPNPKKLARKDNCDYILPDVEYSPEECQYILQVMRKFGLSYPIDENAEFIPSLCDSEMPKDLHPTGWGTPISYEFRYSFLPDSVVQRMMIRLYGSKNFTKLWRRGFRFDEPDHGLITVVDAGGPDDILRIDVYSNKENKGRDVMMGLITNIAAVNAELNLKPEQYIIVHADRGEIAASADMILQAKEKGYTNLPLYSKENGLVEKNVDEILGCTYGRQIIEAAQLVAKDDRRRLSEAVPQIINNYYVYGNIYNSSTPDGLLDLLERMAEQNVQVSRGFIDYLLEQIEGTEDENAKKLAADLKEEKGEGFLKKLSKGIKALPGLATGANILVTDGKAAYDAAKPIIDAVKLALLTQGPQIAEGAMEFFNLLPPG